MNMTKRNIFSAVCTVFALSAALVFLPSCGKQASAPDTSDYGSMNITSEPSGAKVTILGKDVGVTPYITKPVPSAMYIVKFAQDGYEPAWLPVNVLPGRQVDVHADLVPENAVVVIDSEPTGAHVQMDGKDVGDAPVVLTDLPLGSYTATVQMQGYTRKDISWKVQNARPIMINVPLLNNIGTLSVFSDPDSAEIEVDGKAYGTTPFRDTLEQGQHKIRLVKQGYKPYEKIVTVRRDEATDVNVALETLPGSLALDSQPSGAALFIDGVDYGLTPYKRDSVDAGSYRVRITLDGYDPFEDTVTVHPGEPTEYTFSLLPNTGSIVLSVNPPGVNVYLDGRFAAKTEQDPKTRSHNVSKSIRIDGVPAGEHTVTVSNKHAKPNVKTISVTVGKGQTLQVPEIEMWLPDTELIMKTGSRYSGRFTDKYYAAGSKTFEQIRSEGNADDPNIKIAFHPGPGITSEYKVSEIRDIVSLDITDAGE